MIVSHMCYSGKNTCSGLGIKELSLVGNSHHESAVGHRGNSFRANLRDTVPCNLISIENTVGCSAGEVHG